MALPGPGATHWPFRAPDVEVIGKESRVLESVAGVSYYGAIHLVAVENGHASPISGAAVAGDFFRVIGVPPILGRTLSRADDVKGAENVLVITHGLWQRRYGGSRDVIGRRVVVSERPFAIVGVMPPNVECPHGVEAWMTLAAGASTMTNPGHDAVLRDVDLMARLRPGATIEQARNELLGLTSRLEADAPPDAPRGLTPVVRFYRDVVVGDVRPALLMLFGAVGLVLLIASANVANLLLLRGEVRRPELTVRAALGASGGRLARQLLAESLLRALVVAQVALAVTVVAAAGLLTHSLLRLQAVEMGLAADRLVFVRLELPQAKYADNARHLQFLRDVVAQLESAPGIAGATPVNTPPFAGTGGWDTPEFTAEGQSATRAAANPSLNLESVHPNYFQTFEVTLVRGRGFTAADRRGAPEVAVVSEDVAARTWPGEDPIGKRVKLGRSDSTEDWRAWRTVVGVARPTRYRELTAPRPTLYLPAEQFIAAAEMLVLRTASPLALVARLARERVGAVDPAVQVVQVAPFREMLRGPLARPRFNAFLIGMFGMIALLLAAIGLYAVMAAHVRQRYSEIGVRVALGATTADVRGLVLGEGLRLAGMGDAIGLASAVVATRLLRGLLFDVPPLDPASFLASAMLLMGVSALASYLPARRATRVDPIVLLRTE